MTRRFFRPLLILIVLISALASGQTNIPRGSAAPSSPTPIPQTMVPADSKSLEPISSFMPTYPPSAETDKLHGLVVIKIVVSTKGEVTSTGIISGNPLLAQAAVAAVTKWKFKPFIRNGIPVTASTDLPFNFIYCDQLPAADPEPGDTLNRVPNAINVIRISRTAAEQLITHKVKPEYPELAALARIQGTVLLMGDIDKNGRVKVLGVLSGHPLLIKAASDAVSQWRYRPFILDGQPASIQTTIPVEFSLK
ncbi:MAG TPA: energy transducer TonB [Terriglobales bacterium]|nr:energy transducer TonB [Terriglobales bacterium]